MLTAALKHTGNRSNFGRLRKKYKNATKIFERKAAVEDYTKDMTKKYINNDPEPVAPRPDDFQWPKGCVAGINVVANLLEEQIRSTKDRTFQTPEHSRAGGGGVREFSLVVFRNL